MKKEKIKITVMAALLSACFVLTYYFHVVLGRGIVFTHFFYIPIILSGLWWKKRGLIIPIFLSVFLLLQDFFQSPHSVSYGDYSRVFMFLVIGFTVSLLSEKIAKNEEELREHRDRLEKLVGVRTGEILDYQKKLQKLVAELTVTSERERKNIAAELHDRLGQALYASKIKLSMLRETAASPAIAGLIGENIKLTDGMIEDVRRLMFNISTPLLYEAGFKAAVGWLVEQFQKQFEIKLVYGAGSCEKIENLKEEAAVMLYQTVRELLTNAAKHSKAKKIIISIEDDGKNLEIKFEDDGIGFKHSQKNYDIPKGGFGLFSIKEQAGVYGGSLEVVSVVGKGTSVKISLPLSSVEKETKGKK